MRRGSSGDVWRSRQHAAEEVNWRHNPQDQVLEKTYDMLKQDSPKESSPKQSPRSARRRNRKGKQSQARRSSMDIGSSNQAGFNKRSSRRYSSAGPDTPFPDSYYKSTEGVDVEDKDWKNVLVAAIRKSWAKPIEVPESIIRAVYGKAEIGMAA